ncbi:hypothetical protein SI859A1_03629 [Aurantimonas manganoxydans SI85-9A1]|uniref:Uncharacterized protein n=1 Tax=Aurantimonas manganoxydans (strain ATCC BAA-1229 / DSM 21871 / SI85-9A1) TaxID=287752 RepID=Q1YDZ6_AURMS|nr:hypothetical protein SI859A1_03629 [Aurantimonas manganoxydans SI85-9A1]
MSGYARLLLLGLGRRRGLLGLRQHIVLRHDEGADAAFLVLGGLGGARRLDVILGRLGLQAGLVGLADQRFDLGQGLGAGRGLLRRGLGFLGEGAAGAECENRGGEKGGLHEVTPSMRIEGSDPSMARTSARWMAET